MGLQTIRHFSIGLPEDDAEKAQEGRTSLGVGL